ncbi:uncharacterized protein LOC128238177 [Mya arenaria]|uniref:uncharacterized protein LOC128238177 n=1 Tax=Mya arenaria TaxID=6604 RepID=UPI0022E2D3B6|nr:uncharacterized protein LOC128238177 [Mya arenaria]
MSDDTNNASGNESMVRQCKVFLSTDHRGLLFDTVSLSDIANFESYESVLKSVKRIIAMSQKIDARSIDVSGLFYYKRRARSTRMNPVPLVTTTDVFRAIAEHPSGEVPIGVNWTRHDIVLVPKNNSNKTSEVKEELSDGEIPAKKRKIEEMDASGQNVPSFVYNPTTEMLDSGPANPLSVNQEVDRTPTISPTPLMAGSSTTSLRPGSISLILQKLTSAGQAPTTQAPVPADALDKAKVKTIHPSEDTPVTSRPVPVSKVVPPKPQETIRNLSRVPEQKHYSWPTEASCEVLFSYDGVAERKRITNSPLAAVIQRLVRGDYEDLKLPVATKIGSTSVYDSSFMMNSAKASDGSSNPTYPTPIQHVKEAKMEIFKVLSMLCMTRTMFKELLHWMKSLKLEEGYMGKYYISERNVIGSEKLRVMFNSYTDTDPTVRFQNCPSQRATSKYPHQLLYPNILPRPGPGLGEPTGATPPPPPPPPMTATTAPQDMSSTIAKHKEVVSLLTGKLTPAPSPGNKPQNMQIVQALPDGHLMLSDGTVLVPVPGNQIRASELSKHYPLIPSLNSESSKSSRSLPSILQRKNRPVSFPSTDTLSKTQNSLDPKTVGELLKSQNFSGINRSKSNSDSVDSTDLGFQVKTNDSDTESNSDFPTSMVTIKTEPIDFDPGEGEGSFFSSGLHPHDQSLGYMIKTEPPDDYYT